MEDQVICYKQDVLNPFEYKFKQCPEGQLCHGGLNRCTMDPYAKVVNRNPGNTCTQHYECRSKHCSKQRGVCSIPETQTAAETLPSCTEHADCEIGQYCADAALVINDYFPLADPTRHSEFKGFCAPQREEFETCASDFDCQNSLACANTKCQKHGSISDYQLSDNELACKSGFTSASVCYPTPRIVSEQQGPDYKCQSVTDLCVYESTSQDGTPV